MRKEFLRLTGPIPLVPLYALGFWDSRYHPYTEPEALGVIDHYRQAGIPLNVFVVDTDWHVGGSGGYDIEAKYFPDMPGFLASAHQRHGAGDVQRPPPAQRPGAAGPAMLKFRYDGLTGLLDKGLDFWWYDRNWGQIIDGPIAGLDREVWGQRLYTDTKAQLRPDQRPIMMSMPSDHPASHRYPIWWTGDINSESRPPLHKGSPTASPAASA